jgi:hypothetical protein
VGLQRHSRPGWAPSAHLLPCSGPRRSSSRPQRVHIRQLPVERRNVSAQRAYPAAKHLTAAPAEDPALRPAATAPGAKPTRPERPWSRMHVQEIAGGPNGGCATPAYATGGGEIVPSGARTPPGGTKAK